MSLAGEWEVGLRSIIRSITERARAALAAEEKSGPITHLEAAFDWHDYQAALADGGDDPELAHKHEEKAKAIRALLDTYPSQDKP